MLCRAFQAWADKTTHKRDMRQKLMTVSQLLMHGSLARCFQAWQQDSQVPHLAHAPPHPYSALHLQPCGFML